MTTRILVAEPPVVKGPTQDGIDWNMPGTGADELKQDEPNLSTLSMDSTASLPRLLGSCGDTNGSTASMAAERKMRPSTLSTSLQSTPNSPQAHATLYDQLRKIQRCLKFRMISEEQAGKTPAPAESAVACACEVLLIRDIDPANASFQCRFNIYLEWIDKSAIGLPLGEVEASKRKSLGEPEIALQNALSASMEDHSIPEIVNNDIGHVAKLIKYQAVVQMDLNMRMFPFDVQNCTLILGLRARKDRDRALFCQFCQMDRQIRLDEWCLLGSFAKSERPDGRALVRFGVAVGRAYWYYVVNVLLTIVLITVLVFLGYLLPVSALFDRLRGGAAILFAQTTFKLSIENKLPKVAYATAFDQYSMSCQIMILLIISGNVVTSMMHQAGGSVADFAPSLDAAFLVCLGCLFILGNFGWVYSVTQRRRTTYRELHLALQDGAIARKLNAVDSLDATEEACRQAQTLAKGLHFSGHGDRRDSLSIVKQAVRAVSMTMKIWFLHDIDPMSSTFECKFTVYVQWIDDGAIGWPEGLLVDDSQKKDLDMPELCIHNAVESTLADGPSIYVVSSARGQVMMHCTYHARLQLHLNLRRFPFDSQRLPILVTLPREQDRDRAFVLGSCELKSSFRDFDEWSFEGHESYADYIEGVARASFAVLVRRRPYFYVVSVLAALFGISSLTLTLFVIDLHHPEAFADQAKIFLPLLMTLLAFKLSHAGKLPKVAQATIFDRYLLACQALFFAVAVSCAVVKILYTLESTVQAAPQVRANVAFAVASAWLMVNIWLIFEVRLGRDSTAFGRSDGHLLLSGLAMPASANFEQQSNLVQSPMLGILPPAQLTPSAVMLRIWIKHIHSVSPANASFQCEFMATITWLDELAKGCDVGAKCEVDGPCRVRVPHVMVQNAIQCKSVISRGPEVVCTETGQVTCHLSVRAKIQMHFDLAQFPFDEQSLAVVLMLNEPCDSHRHLFLERCGGTDAVRTGEWSVLSDFASYEYDNGGSRAVFGVCIHRSSRYYVMHLITICLFSSFAMYVYILDVEDFANRGKILMGVLLVQVVAKLSVASKLPRIARLTVFDRCALGCLSLLFSITICTASCCTLMSLRFLNMGSHTMRTIDLSLGATLFLIWVAWIVSINQQVRRGYAAPPAHSRGDAGSKVHNAIVEELEVLRSSSLSHSKVVSPSSVQPRSPSLPGAHCNLMAIQANAEHPWEQQAVSLGVKIWIISDVDVSSATFECKFHVFLDWLDPAAMQLSEGQRISVSGASDVAGLDIPKVTIRNAICVFVEDISDPEVVNADTGQVCCRIQYHARVHADFELRYFPFDCQTLEITLMVQSRRDGHERFFVSRFCEIDDERANMDHWKRLHVCLGYTDKEGPNHASLVVMVERDSKFYVSDVLAQLAITATATFSFFLMDSSEFSKRLIDTLKIVLMQSTIRFSAEHRLPKVTHWTPFDFYSASCQILVCSIALSFFVSKVLQQQSHEICVSQIENLLLFILLGLWILWNSIFWGCYARMVKRAERNRVISCAPRTLPGSLQEAAMEEKIHQPVSALGNATDSTSSWTPSSGRASAIALQPQLISVAFRIWLVRNIDPVRATFECKFRVFLEWLDDAAVGAEKGKKLKHIPVPDVTIANAIQYVVLDKSSAPEVVNSSTGHLAFQILYRATLRMDQQVQLFPFDCQWLAIVLSLREGVERNRSFLYQYCEIEGQLQLDEWKVFPQPAFSTLTKNDAPSIQDTVVCGVLIRRNSWYYVVNIITMLGLISSLIFALYAIHVTEFFERAEVFLGIFPLIVIFKFSAQGKLPRVGYATRFDRYARTCLLLFSAIVFGCMVASLLAKPPGNVSEACARSDFFLSSLATQWTDASTVPTLELIEKVLCASLAFFWISWNMKFAVQAWQVTGMQPLEVLRSNIKPRLKAPSGDSSSPEDAEDGLAPCLSAIAGEQREDAAVSPGFEHTLSLTSWISSQQKAMAENSPKLFGKRRGSLAGTMQ